MFCKHDWEVLSAEVTKSKFESSLEALKAAGADSALDIPHQLCGADRKHIQLVSCKRCGKLKRFVERI